MILHDPERALRPARQCQETPKLRAAYRVRAKAERKIAARPTSRPYAGQRRPRRHARDEPPPLGEAPGGALATAGAVVGTPLSTEIQVDGTAISDPVQKRLAFLPTPGVRVLLMRG